MKMGMDQTTNVATLAESALYLSEMLMDLGELHAALDMATQAVDLAKKSEGEANNDAEPNKRGSLHIYALAHKGGIHHQRGEWTHAKRLFKEAENKQNNLHGSKLLCMAGCLYCAFLLEPRSRTPLQNIRARASKIQVDTSDEVSSSHETLAFKYPCRDKALAEMILVQCFFREGRVDNALGSLDE